MIFYRLVPTIEILLTLEPNEDEKKLYGYQEPLDESEVQELEESVDRPRFRPRGDGPSRRFYDGFRGSRVGPRGAFRGGRGSYRGERDRSDESKLMRHYYDNEEGDRRPQRRPY